MIEINLVPDVKQEFIKAQRVRNAIISIAIIVCLACVGALVLVSLYVFGAQAWGNKTTDDNIAAGIKKLQEVQDLDKALTVQNQLKNISEIHSETQLDARLFDMLATVTPTGDNEVSISKFMLDTDEGTITIEGNSKSGYTALDAFKKTILATNFVYSNEDGEKQEVPLTTEIADGDRSYGEDENGEKSLQFTFAFEYPEELLSRDSLNAEIVGPDRTNATDSALEIPKSIFSNSGGRN